MAEVAIDWSAPPRERIETLPEGWPERTLGLVAAAWMTDNLTQPNGKHAGEPFMPTERQIKFLCWFYALDSEGRFIQQHAVRRLAKGSGKSPFAAALAVFEFIGPCRFKAWTDDPYFPEAQSQPMSRVQVVATSEQQTANTMLHVRGFCSRGSKLARKYGIQAGKTFLEAEGPCRLEQMTASSRSIEGGEATFVIADETEHWVPSAGGNELMAAIRRNVAKSGSRVMETSNAWKPGENCVAEQSFEDWVMQEEGLLRGETGGEDDLQMLYDARIAPPNTILTDEDEEGKVRLDDALRFVYEDCDWVINTPALRNIKKLIWTPSTSESDSRRFYLNQPTAAENSWASLEEWTLLRKPDRVVSKDEPIVMFFDGSKSNDHTALVGCCMEDGHIFVLGHWKPEGSPKMVNVAAVDSAIHRIKDEYNVVAFWGDVREWESFVRTDWPELFGDQLIVPAVKQGMAASTVAWDMRSHAYQFAEAAETAFEEIQQQAFTHDGSAALGEHVSNCRVNEYKGRFSVKKESPKSPKKIDLAVCMIGARMLYRYVKDSKEWETYSKPKGGWVVWTG